MKGFWKRGILLCIWLMLALGQTAAAQGISLNMADVNLLPGMKVKLKASAGSRKVTFKSSSTAVASVGKSSGVIKAVKSGKCYITCKAKGMKKVTVTVNVYKSAKKAAKKQKLVIYGHRGNRDDYPENSLPAITDTRRCGWSGAECDVYYTHSGEFLISHDKNLKRTCGVNVSILDVSTENREQYPLLGGTARDPLLIPTLEEVLTAMRERGSRLILHVKNLDLTYAEEFLQQIRNSGMQKKIIVYGENTAVLSYLSAQGLQTGLLTYALSGSDVVRAADACREAGIDWLMFYRMSKVTKGKVDYVHSLGLKAGAVVTNTKTQLLWAMDLNMDLVMTNHRYW